MSFNPSRRPSEDEITIMNERTWLAGMILSAVAYGIVFILFILTLKQLVRTTTKQNYTQKLLLIIYITVMFILGTLYLASIAKMTELGFIDYRLYPGGPAAFERLKFSSPIGELSNVSYVIANWLVGGMMIYRYLVIFRSSAPQFPLWVVMAIPVLGYMTSFSLSIVWLIQISAPASSPWNTYIGGINFTTPFCLISFSFHISMTIAICARLLFYRRRITSILGPNHGTHYTTMAAMFVESASLSSVFTLLFFVPFALHNPIQNAFIRVVAEVQILATLLIIYHVANGTAWVSETSRTMFGSKENQILAGVRVQIESSGPQRDEMPSQLDGGRGRESELRKFTV